jgi:hypothetical protein
VVGWASFLVFWALTVAPGIVTALPAPTILAVKTEPAFTL